MHLKLISVPAQSTHLGGTQWSHADFTRLGHARLPNWFSAQMRKYLPPFEVAEQKSMAVRDVSLVRIHHFVQIHHFVAIEYSAISVIVVEQCKGASDVLMTGTFVCNRRDG
jgi:hypothetical protein